MRHREWLPMRCVFRYFAGEDAGGAKLKPVDFKATWEAPGGGEE